jgi:molybdopterin molybdotransferase
MVGETVVMRGVEEAQQEMLEHFKVLPTERVGLMAALGRTLAADVRADMDVPPFANSAMDGYAVQGRDLLGDAPTVLRILGEVPAGGVATIPVEPGTAMRIMTGAPMPDGADTVVPFEDTDEGRADSLWDVGQVRVLHRPAQGANVRQRAEDLRAGAVVVRARTVVTPAAVGLLASVGAAGEKPGPGQIRNANGYSNAAQVLAAGGEPLQLPIARDTEADVRAQLEAGLAWGADLFLTSGGVSVGDYDVVKKVLMAMGEMQFWRVRMKPGKPITFGVIQGVPLLGLPGNPVSAMVVFELFGRPALLKMQGRRTLHRPVVQAAFDGTIRDRGDRRQYVRVRVGWENGEFRARATGEQGSGILSSMLGADGLLIVPEGVSDVAPGMRLDVLMTTWPEHDPPDAEGVGDAGDDCC